MRLSQREPFVVLLSDAMIAIELRSIDAKELEQILKLSLAVTSRHDAADCCCCCCCSAAPCRLVPEVRRQTAIVAPFSTRSGSALNVGTLSC